MKSLIISLSFVLLLTACTTKNTPVDNPSYVDRNPQFENQKESQKKTLDEVSMINGRLTKVGKAMKAKAGEPQLIDNIRDYGNRPYSITKYDDKPKLIGYWASWCGPCYKEKPLFRAMAKKYPNINFISLSVDKTISDAQTFLDNRQLGISEYDYWIGESDANKLKWYTMRPIDDGTGQSATISLPTYVLIGTDGKIISNDVPYPSSGQMEAFLEKAN